MAGKNPARNPPSNRKKRMSLLNLSNEADCRYDILSLGEVLRRLDPAEGRIRTARQSRASSTV
jgi:hypothetical protein